MTDVAVRVDGLGKRYRLGEREPYRTLRDALTRARRRGQNARDHGLELWALRDVGFEVKRGDVVGIIGRNGAGKSTLLKILSRITEPTTGRAEIRGRVGSLLEVGTGFHPELTGRENVFLNGAILGMSRAEIRRHFDDIVAFAEVERFIDTPVKRYSSGMHVRLAFAVAAHLHPEVLIVDEVLAVGDAAFQEKCLGKLDDVAREGRTILFVSHNMSAIQRLCAKAILLTRGRVEAHGDTNAVAERYVGGHRVGVHEWTGGGGRTRSASIERVNLANEQGGVVEHVTTADALRVFVAWTIVQRVPDLQVTVGLNDGNGEPIFGTCPQDAGHAVPADPGTYQAIVVLPREILLAKRYTLRVVLWTPSDGTIDAVHDIEFTAQDAPSLGNSVLLGRAGHIAIRCEWSLERTA